MKCDANKEGLVEFWSDQNLFSSGKKLYVNVGQKFFLLRRNDEDLIESSEVEELENSQEEADTKVFLCAQHASRTSIESVCIKTVDSDIAIYALYFQDKIETNLYVQMGVGNRKRILNINNISLELGQDVV